MEGAGGSLTTLGKSRMTIIVKGGSTVILKIDKAKMSDAGRYWAGVSCSGTDSYAQFSISVRKPVTSQASPSIQEKIEESVIIDDPIDVWTAQNLDPTLPASQRSLAHKAIEKCEGNTACAISALHVMTNSQGTDCWVCAHHRPEVRVSSIATNDQPDISNSTSPCFFPKRMLDLLTMIDQWQNGTTPTNDTINDIVRCQDPTVNVTQPMYTVTVRPVKAPVCLCANSTTPASPNLGISSCSSNIHMTGQDKCSFTHPNGPLAQ